MGVVQKSTGRSKIASKYLKSEPAIVAGIANATLTENTTNWNEMITNYDVIRDHIEFTISGFDNYNERVRKPGGFYLPNGSRTRAFTTPNKRAQFTVNPLPTRQVANGNFIMMTIRSHDQYNTTIYGMNDRYRGIYNERRVVLMNPEDMKLNGYKSEDIVHLTSHFNQETRRAENFKIVPYNIPKGCVGTYFPETNVLVAIDNFARESGTPVSKYIEVSIEKK